MLPVFSVRISFCPHLHSMPFAGGDILVLTCSGIVKMRQSRYNKRDIVRNSPMPQTLFLRGIVTGAAPDVLLLMAEKNKVGSVPTAKRFAFWRTHLTPEDMALCDEEEKTEMRETWMNPRLISFLKSFPI